MTIEIIKSKLSKIKDGVKFVEFLQYVVDNSPLNIRYEIVESFHDYHIQKDFNLDFYLNDDKEMLFPEDNFYEEYKLINSKFIELSYIDEIKEEIVIDNNKNPIYNLFIGKNVVKKSGKPFKSNEKVGMVVDITINPHTNKKVFLMNDDSIVDCHVVKLVV